MADGLPVTNERQPDTASLARRLRDGDREAVRELYRAFGAAVFAVCRRTLEDRALAEEAVQQTFLQLWRAAARIDPERDLRPWLFTIARKVAVDVARREQGRCHDELPERSLPDPGEGIERAWATWRVREAVDRLAPDEREVVRLQHFAGLSHTEIAEQLRMPVGTVKSRSHRAHQHLDRQLSAVDVAHVASCATCDDRQASYLEGGDAEAEAHVASCATCRRVKDELDALRKQLAEPGTWGEPDDDLEERIMAAVATEHPRRHQVTDLADRQRERQRRRQGFWVVAAAAAIAALIGTVAVLARVDDVDRRFALAGTGPLPGARAEVRTRDTSSGIEIRLDAAGLSRAPAGSFYEGWMRGPKGLVSIGTFHTGAGTVVLWSGVSLDDYDEITVTLEPEDGNPMSSGVRVLAGPIPTD